ncbi:nucleotidyltransferase domain-containing protein [Sedimenticola selenatireducens]|uniref:Nucleotidyltransferase family protein n=1 Tax=Sedimenticola selenatireducens TaxID=191960 RepID=A0A558DQX3_9GAMM|nr:nucleotidyltransferase family protein [Sedimenticola selenatireducens]TVO73480.1 nucleotidyltransferase family protein [Sedimenticola selenatireducens]TVT63421.1 MAG: nucleotidyltransferase family protein [Sedimenticola selenatireducens]
MNLVVEALVNPESVKNLSDTQWDLLIRQARSSELLAHLYHRFMAEGIFSSIPEKPKNHLKSDEVLATKQHEAARWEILQIYQALESIGTPLLLLKGAAYLHADLPPAPGRFFSDIDILVPKTVINDAEEKLHQWGWLTTHNDDYDQRYYRKWMHEIPPLQHVGRHSTIDVHHNILPLTARLHPDPEKMIQASVQIDESFELYTLCPADMILHSATHLFHDGELEHGLRDLVDLDRLLRHFGNDASFWETLINRANEIDLSRPLFYALRYTSKILNTPIPLKALNSKQLDKPAYPVQFFMDHLFLRALAPAHKSSNDWFTGIARWFLYIRSHYLRMPLHLLIPHLFYKAYLRPYKEWRENRGADSGKKTGGHKESESEIDIFE